MSVAVDALRYSVVTPTRNEAANLPRLAGALAAQTLPPSAWVVVDDGSTDGTREVLEDLARRFEWVIPVERVRPTDGELARGRRHGGALESFRDGLSRLPGPVDVVIKADADVDFGPDYCERLIGRFADDPRLAIASGAKLSYKHGQWVHQTKAPSTVWGGSRAYRWDCLGDVCALEPRMGWDGLDEISVQLRGLRTATFADLSFREHRATGGRERSSLHHGDAVGRASWYMGYRPSYLVMRALYRAGSEPASLAMVWGYVAAAVARESRCPDQEIVSALRDRQRLRSTLRRGAPA